MCARWGWLRSGGCPMEFIYLSIGRMSNKQQSLDKNFGAGEEEGADRRSG